MSSYLKHNGQKDPRVADIYNFLGHLYKTTGQEKKAEEYLLKALDTYKQSIGKRHSLVAEVSSDLGQLFVEQKKFKEGEMLINESLTIRRQSLGESHTKVAITFFDLGKLCEKQNQLPQAEEYYKKAISIYKSSSTLVTEHAALGFRSLANLYSKQSRFHDAEISFRQALEIYQKLDKNDTTSGSFLTESTSDSPKPSQNVKAKKEIIADIFKRLGIIAIKQEDRKIGGDYFLKSAKIFQQIGKNEVAAAIYIEHAALSENPEESYIQALKCIKEQQGENHPQTAEVIFPAHFDLIHFFHNPSWNSSSKILFQNQYLIHLGKFYSRSNNPTLAIETLEEAGKIFAENQDPKAKETTELVEQIKSSQQPSTLGNVGKFLWSKLY